MNGGWGYPNCRFFINFENFSFSKLYKPLFFGIFHIQIIFSKKANCPLEKIILVAIIIIYKQKYTSVSVVINACLYMYMIWYTKSAEHCLFNNPIIHFYYLKYHENLQTRLYAC